MRDVGCGMWDAGCGMLGGGKETQSLLSGIREGRRSPTPCRKKLGGAPKKRGVLETEPSSIELELSYKDKRKPTSTLSSFNGRR